MQKHPWLLFVSFLNAFVLRARHSFVSLLCVLLLFCSTDCWFSTSDLRWSQPNTPIIQICDKPLDVPDDVNLWGYDFVTKRLVTGEHPADLRLFDNADAFFEFNPDAPASSALEMPSEYGLTCAKRTASFVDASVHSFPPSSDLFRSQKPCPAQIVDTVNRAASHFFADTTGGKKPCNTPTQANKPQAHVRVCARPQGVGNNVDEWASSDGKGNLLTNSDKVFADAVAKAEIIFIFDTNAPPDTVYWFVKDPAELSCPGKPPPEPYKEARASGRLEMMAALASMDAALNGGTPKKGDGQTNELSGPDGKGPPLKFLEWLARESAYVGALASGDTSGDPKDPNGSRFGIPGGKNVGGPNFLILQAASGPFALIGNPLESGKDFIKKVVKALTEGKVAGILNPKVLSKEIAEQLAKEPEKKELQAAIKALKEGDTKPLEALESFGKAMAVALRDAGVIMPYSRAQIFTRGWGGKYQAHHALEVAMAEDVLDMNAKAIADIPAIILTEAEHIEITAKLNAARNKIMGGSDKIPSPQQLWKIYQKAYGDRPAWLEAIKGYFPNVR